VNRFQPGESNRSARLARPAAGGGARKVPAAQPAGPPAVGAGAAAADVAISVASSDAGSVQQQQSVDVAAGPRQGDTIWYLFDDTNSWKCGALGKVVPNRKSGQWYKFCVQGERDWWDAGLQSQGVQGHERPPFPIDVVWCSRTI
jgi:hypothetical protein